MYMYYMYNKYVCIAYCDKMNQMVGIDSWANIVERVSRWTLVKKIVNINYQIQWNPATSSVTGYSREL